MVRFYSVIVFVIQGFFELFFKVFFLLYFGYEFGGHEVLFALVCGQVPNLEFLIIVLILTYPHFRFSSYIFD